MTFKASSPLLLSKGFICHWIPSNFLYTDFHEKFWRNDAKRRKIMLVFTESCEKYLFGREKTISLGQVTNKKRKKQGITRPRPDGWVKNRGNKRGRNSTLNWDKIEFDTFPRASIYNFENAVKYRRGTYNRQLQSQLATPQLHNLQIAQSLSKMISLSIILCLFIHNSRSKYSRKTTTSNL